jgi:hypothetical protein
MLCNCCQVEKILWYAEDRRAFHRHQTLAWECKISSLNHLDFQCGSRVRLRTVEIQNTWRSESHVFSIFYSFLSWLVIRHGIFASHPICASNAEVVQIFRSRWSGCSIGLLYWNLSQGCGGAFCVEAIHSHSDRTSLYELPIVSGKSLDSNWGLLTARLKSSIKSSTSSIPTHSLIMSSGICLSFLVFASMLA